MLNWKYSSLGSRCSRSTRLWASSTLLNCRLLEPALNFTSMPRALLNISTTSVVCRLRVSSMWVESFLATSFESSIFSVSRLPFFRFSEQVFLGSPGIPKNEIMTFDQLFPAEWMDFLRMTAKRKKLEDKLESYFLADGRFFAVEKSADPFIRSEIPPMREVLSRCLAGQKIPGAGRKSEKEIAAGTRKFQIDPFFARFRAKTNKSQSITPQQTAKNPQKGAK